MPKNPIKIAMNDLRQMRARLATIHTEGPFTGIAPGDAVGGKSSKDGPCIHFLPSPHIGGPCGSFALFPGVDVPEILEFFHDGRLRLSIERFS